MRRNRKPGPKSRTVDRLSCSQSADDASFRTPELDGNATDYNLDFTTTARSRTLRGTMTTNNATPATQRQHRRTSEEPSTSHHNVSRVVAMARNVSKQPQQLQQRRRKQTTPRSRLRRFQQEVRRLQNSKDFLIPRLPFARVVREVMMMFVPDFRITREALEALQTAVELYMTHRLEDAYLLTLHRGRVTLTVQDLELINFLRSFDKR